MARVECALEETLVPGPSGGKPVPGVCLSCGDCGHSVEGPGSSDDPASIRPLLTELRRTCPQQETNRYIIRED